MSNRNDKQFFEGFTVGFILGLINFCYGCHKEFAQAYAHIVPKARCKQLRKTELIWSYANMFQSCHTCNSVTENVSSADIRNLKNFEYIKEYMSKHDPERASKLI